MVVPLMAPLTSTIVCSDSRLMLVYFAILLDRCVHIDALTHCSSCLSSGNHPRAQGMQEMSNAKGQLKMSTAVFGTARQIL